MREVHAPSTPEQGVEFLPVGGGGAVGMGAGWVWAVEEAGLTLPRDPGMG